MKIFSKVVLSIFLILFACRAGITQTAGDIAIIGTRSADSNKFAFVALTDIPAYTYITFTDRPWTKPNGPFGSEDKEGHVTWSYSSIVTKGTVIIITVSISGGTATANIGGVTAFNIFGISDSGEQIIAFKGDWQNRPIDNGADAKFLYAFSTKNFITSGTTSPSTSYLPSALSNYSTYLSASSSYKNSYFANGTNSGSSFSISGTKSELQALFTDGINKYYKTNSAINLPTYSITVIDKNSLSDVIENPDFTYFSNINYSLYQGNGLTVENSVEAGSFTIRDGGGVFDGDAYGTTLTDVAFTAVNSQYLRKAAIFDGSANCGEVSAGSGITFSGLNLEAPDNGSKTFSLRVSFQEAVTDNGQFSFAINSVTAGTGGSGFAQSNGGGAATKTDGDINRIEVTASKLAFFQQPSDAKTLNTMLPLVSVKATDENLNTDLDYIGNISVTSSGTLKNSPQTETAVSGLAVFNSIIHTQTGTGLSLSAASNSLTPANSTAFNILKHDAGTLLSEENFEFTGLLTQNGYTAISGTGVNNLSASTESLVYADYGSSGTGSGLEIKTEGEDAAKEIEVQNSPGIVYSSFLVKVISAQSGDYVFALSPDSNPESSKSSFFIKSSSNTGFVNFGAGTAGDAAVYGSNDYALNTTYLIVLKYEFSEGAFAKTSLYVNPNLFAEPENPESETLETLSENSPQDIGWYVLRQGNQASSPNLIIDGIRVASDWGALCGNPEYSSTEYIATGNYNNVNVLSGSVTLNGDVTVKGELNLQGGIMYLNDDTLNVSGTLTRNAGKIDASNSQSVIEFTNQELLNLSSDFFNGELKNLKINSTGGINLSTSLEITNNLILYAGKLYIGGNNLTVKKASGAGSESYVVTDGSGYLIMKSNGNGGRVYPVGMAESYNPVYLKHTGTAADFSVRISSSYELNSKAVPRVWEISPSVTVNNCTVELVFNSSDLEGSLFNPLQTVVLGNFDGSVWQPNSASILNAESPYTLRTNNLKITGSAVSKYAIGNNGAFTIYSQNFDGDWTGTGLKRNLPDLNWESTFDEGNNSWRREDDGSNAGWASAIAGTVKPYGNTGHSANFHSYGAELNGAGALVLKNLTLDGDVLLSFDYTNASGSDRLDVYFSSNNGSGYTQIGTFTTGLWSKKILSLGNFSSQSGCRIKFDAVSDYGRSDIGLDNINVYNGTLSEQDPRIISIDVSHTVSGTVTPRVTVKNFGTGTAVFNAKLSASGYHDETTNTNVSLNAGSTVQLAFSLWNPAPGNNYTLSSDLFLAGNPSQSVSSLEKNVETNISGNWSEGSNPSGLVSVLGSGAATSSHFFSTGGFPLEEASKVYRYTIGSNTWSVLPSLPGGRFYHASAIAGGYLFAIGGKYNGAYLSTVYRYKLSDSLTGVWEQFIPASNPLPPLGWCKAAVYESRFILLAGGYNGTSVLKSVYMLDVNNPENGWTALTSMPSGRFGGAFTVTGDKLVYVAGASGTSSLSNAVFTGTLILSEGIPTSISWEEKANTFPGNGKEVKILSSENLSESKSERSVNSSKEYNNGSALESTFPAGSLYCLDAVPWGNDAIAISGGTRNSSTTPEDPAPFFVYKISADTWSAMPELPVPAAGSSVGSANTEGTAWKYISFSGETLNNLNSPAMQIWSASNLNESYTGSFGVQIEGGSSLPESGSRKELVIELRESVVPYHVAETKIAVQEGTGFITLDFTNVESTKPYYIVVRYSNGIETWSAQPQYFINGILNYDFTTDSAKAYGNNMVKVNGKWCVISGDINQDGKINAIDRGICWNDRGTADVYSDLNGDGVVNENDRAILSGNKFIEVKKPEGAVVSNKVRKR